MLGRCTLDGVHAKGATTEIITGEINLPEICLEKMQPNELLWIVASDITEEWRSVTATP